MKCTQENTECYCEKSQQQNNNIVPILEFLHPCIYVMLVTEAKQIPKIVRNRKQ